MDEARNPELYLPVNTSPAIRAAASSGLVGMACE
jgi:hypothetical protein